MALSVDSHGPIFEAAAREWNVDPRLLRAVATQESGGNPNARSRAGAVGVMQLMPGTAKDLGVTDLTNAEQSIYGGAKYLSQMLDRYKHPEIALAAYNAGPGRVDAFLKGGALPDETLKYVPAVKAHFERLGPVADRRASGVMSDDDFLKAIGGAAKPATTAPGATISDDDFLKAIAPITEDKPAPTDKRQQGDPDNPVMPDRGQAFRRRADLGTRSSTAVETGTTVGDIAASAGNIGSAAAQGFREGSQPMPPLVTPVMEGLGVYPPAAGGGTLLQRANKLVIDPLATGGELALRLAGGLFRGAQAGVAQAGAEIDQPQLGRDLAAMPDAFMGALPGGAPRQPNRLAPAAPEYVPLPDKPRIYMRADSAPANPAPEFMPPGVQRPPAAAPTAPVAPPEFLPPGATMAPAADDAAMGGRRSAGAAASTDAEANMPRAEMQAQRATAERDRLLEPQPVGIDKNEYIPGVQTTEAQMVQDARTSRKEKLLEMEMPEQFKATAKANNDVRATFYDDLAGTATQKRRLEEARGQAAEADLRATWRNKQDADPAPVSEKAATILASPDGRRPAVRGVVDSVMREMVDSNGKPITDPEILYGVRKHIDDLLSKEGAKDNPSAVRATAQLLELKGALDGVIETAAPGFRQYLNNFAEASRPIDEMTVLQEYAPRIRDSQNRITYSSVQRMLKDIVEDRAAKGINAAQSISDETMNSLFALRNDLRRVASSDDLAKARGSDTVQNAMDLVKNVGGKGLAEGAGFLAAGMPGGSLVLGGITSAIRGNKLKGDVQRALFPDRNKLTPPQ
jgi:hypothetical protein